MVTQKYYCKVFLKSLREGLEGAKRSRGFGNFTLDEFAQRLFFFSGLCDCCAIEFGFTQVVFFQRPS
jgi:hypothetical protein